MDSSINVNDDSQDIECGEITVYCPLLNQIIIVNENCVPLLKELWTLDLFALSGCAHDNGHQVCLEFSDRNDVEYFLRHISRAIGEIDGASNNLRKRMFGIHNSQDDSDDPLNWTYYADVFDVSKESAGAKRNAEPWPFNIIVVISVIFPRSDYDFVLHAIKNEVEARHLQNSTGNSDTTAADVGENP